MIVGTGDLRYEWIDAWANTTYGTGLPSEWTHHGLTCTDAGEIVVCHPDDDRVLVLDGAGELRASWPTGLTQPHGFAVVVSAGTESVWICDAGVRLRRGRDGAYEPDWSETGGRVVRFRLSDGLVEQILPSPAVSAYREQRYSPTGVTVDGDRMWIADGYGASLVHRFACDGTLELTLDGASEGAGRFDCPHACVVDRRRSTPELYVADRANHRLVVFDRDGRFHRVVGAELLLKPSALTIWQDLLIVADLRGRLTVLDAHDRLVGHIGEHAAISSPPAGFPNALDRHGHPVRPTRLEAGRFNSPHDVAADSAGNVYVTEYLVGGRLTKLAHLPS